MNFREELKQIIVDRLHGEENVRHQAEFVLKNILECFKGKSKEELAKTTGIELEFAYDKEKLYVKEHSDESKEIFHFVFANSEATQKVVCYIESKLINEGFLKTSTLNAREHRCFKVKII